MKDLDNLIEYYTRRSEMYRAHVAKQERDTDRAYNNGIAEGFMMAKKELEKTNKLIDEKLKALF